MAYHCNIIADGDSSEQFEIVPFVQFLERKINGWGYNCYIPDRDIPPGRPILEQYGKMHSENKVTFVAITSPYTSEFFRYIIGMLLIYQLQSSHSDIKRPTLVPVYLNIDHLNDPVLDVIKGVRIYGSKEDEWEDLDSNSRAFSQLREVLMKYHPLAKPASEKDLSNISEYIGFNWEMLAPFLIGKNSTATVEQIKENHKVTLQRVYALLCKWRTQTDDPSLAHLFHSMYQAGTSVTIDWNNIAHKLKVALQDIQACKAGYPGQEQDTGQQQASGMMLPTEIQEMDQSSIQLYRQLLDEGYEVVYNIRVVVVGHKGAGKTTLTKRLFNRDVVIGKEESTNGIEVHVDRCKVSLETGQWIISESDKKPTNASNRLVKLLKKPETFTGSDLREMEVNNDTVEEDSFEKADKKDVSDEEEAFSTNETKKREIAKDLQDTLQESMQMQTVDSKTADVSIWDFAGQTEFYDTHQVFLSKRAIYLLVTDMSKQVNDIVEDGNKNWKISEFVDFWLTSIYEFCGTKDSDGPPVILVGTFADKLKQESKEETIGTNFFKDLRKCLIDYKATFNLLKKCISIDNSIKDDRIEELKQHIVGQASKQAYWGEHYPAKWITLERSIGKWKDKGEKILKKDQLFDLNSKLPVPIKQKDGLDLFLRFHHDSGNILYFSEEELSNTIVLDPQWLIDAFKSLITARYFCISQDPAIFQEWIKFEESAILKVTLVEKIWELKESTKFHKHLLLKYLEKLGIIAKPHHLPGTTDVTDYYFAPCFLKQTPPDDLLSPELLPENRRSTSKLCLTTELHFLHAAVFNKLLAACINKWQLSKRDGKYLVYRGCAIFDLEQNHTLYVYFFNHVIQIWLTKCSTKKEKPSQSVCLDVYTFLLDRLTNCLNRSGNVKVLFKCSSSKHNSIENMFPIDELSEKSEVVCKCTTEEHVFETKELTEYWLNSRKFPKDSCIFDGRLIVLDSNQINVLEASLDEKPIGQGGIGTVYRCNNPDIFGIPVAVKKINTKGDSKIESQVRREKIACRLMNPFILPLLAVFEKSNESNKNREVWFVFPLCENGDLYEVLKHDRTESSLTLNAQKRVKILLQVALAIQYIHTAVPDVRAVILHKDIASKNIVLDDMFNARLIDFGLAREEDDNSTTGGGRLYYSHPNVGKEGASESWDYYSFGVIVREMITDFGPEGNKTIFLKNMTAEDFEAEGVTNNIYEKIWNFESLDNAYGRLKDIATQLLEQTVWKVQDFTKNVIVELQKMYKGFNPSCILDVAKNVTDPPCHSCMINKKANQTSMNQKHDDNCIQEIEVCIACEKNSFLNPITCYCGTKLTPNIGYRWAALLVAGKDTEDANRVEISKALTKDVKDLEKLLTSLTPRVFGISNNNVRTVVPSAPDKIDDGEKLWPKFKESIRDFSQRTDIDTMLIYISCHGARSNGSEDFKFQLGSSPDDSITLQQFEEELELLGKIKKLIIVLDRCYPPLVRLEKRNREYIQMNSCKQDQKAQMDNNGSLFTRFFIRGLKAKSEGKICPDNCKPCIDYWDRSKDFITVYNLYYYIKGHLSDEQTPFCTTQVTDHNIAFYTGDRVEIQFSTGDRVEIQFSHKDSSKNIPLDHIKDIEELKKKLKEAFGQETDEVCILKDTFRKVEKLDQNLYCDTIDKVMLAWVQRHRLYVTFNP